MNGKLLLACLLVMGAAAARTPSRPQMTCDPNDPEKTRTIISREEREKLGLPLHTWTGVVHPDVYPRFDRLNQTIASLKERVNKKDEQAFRALSGIRFQGMVYVQVQLKDRDAQRRVLASLKASEFHAPFLSEKSAGLTGYITKEGLDKLAKNPDVAGVCLDDKPLPEKAKTIYKDDLPPAKPGEAAKEPGVSEGKVDPDVYRAFALSDRVDVSIALRDESLPELTDRGPEMRARLELRNQAVKQLQDHVLSTVSADDFWLWVRLSPGLSGFINKEGLQKLWNHPDVQRIYVKQLYRIAERSKNGKHFSP